MVQLKSDWMVLHLNVVFSHRKQQTLVCITVLKGNVYVELPWLWFWSSRYVRVIVYVKSVLETISMTNFGDEDSPVSVPIASTVKAKLLFENAGVMLSWQWYSKRIMTQRLLCFEPIVSDVWIHKPYKILSKWNEDKFFILSFLINKSFLRSAIKKSWAFQNWQQIQSSGFTNNLLASQCWQQTIPFKIIPNTFFLFVHSVWRDKTVHLARMREWEKKFRLWGVCRSFFPACCFWSRSMIFSWCEALSFVTILALQVSQMESLPSHGHEIRRYEPCEVKPSATLCSVASSGYKFQSFIVLLQWRDIKTITVVSCIWRRSCIFGWVVFCGKHFMAWASLTIFRLISGMNSVSFPDGKTNGKLSGQPIYSEVASYKLVMWTLLLCRALLCVLSEVAYHHI